MRSIQNFSVASVAFLFALLSQIIPAHADNEKLDFTLMNKTGYGIKAVYIAPSDSTEWGDNLISQPLENG